MAYKMKSGPSAMFGSKPHLKGKGATAMYGPKAMKDKGAMAMKKGPMAMKEGPMAMKKGPMAVHMSKVQPHKKGATAMYGKGPKAMSKTDKGIEGLGSKNKSGGKYI